MAKSYRQKLKLLYVIEIFKKHSDEEHPITADFICNELQKYDISAERKSIYNDIEALMDYGLDIIKSTAPRGWFLGEREFCEAEIYLLADAIRTAKFITADKTRELIKKLDSFISHQKLSERESKVYFSADTKCDNKEIFYSIDNIITAINEHKKIEFNYVNRILTPDRSLGNRAKKMKISPYALAWRDDQYYLLGNYEKYDNIIHLRLDRIHSVNIVNEPCRHFSEVSPYTDYFDTADYTEKLFGMQGGKLCNIELKCKKDIIEQVVDRFGEVIFIRNVTEDDFVFSVSAALSPALVTFIMNYGSDIKVISPKELSDMVRLRAEEILKIYK